MENVMGNELRESLLGHVDYDPEFEYGRIRHNIWVDACNSHSIVAYFITLMAMKILCCFRETVVTLVMDMIFWTSLKR